MEPFILIGILIILVPLAYGGWLAAPFVPTKRADVKRALQVLNLKPESTVIDLGCGDGRFLLEAAKQGHYGVGYEIAWLPALLGRIQARRAGLKTRVTIRIKNFFKIPLPPSDAVIFFLMDGKRGLRVAKYVEQQVKPGTKVVAMVWPVPQWESRLVLHDKPEGQLSLYLYQL